MVSKVAGSFSGLIMVKSNFVVYGNLSMILSLFEKQDNKLGKINYHLQLQVLVDEKWI